MAPDRRASQLLATVALAVVLLGVAGTTGGHAAGPGPDGGGAAVVDASGVRETPDNGSADVSFTDQVPQDAGTLVDVDRVDLPDGGFVAIYRESETGPVIGVSDYLPPGRHEFVAVRLEEAITGESLLVAVVHRDSDGDRTFDWVASDGEDDRPYTEDGDPVSSEMMPRPPGGHSPTMWTETPTPTATPTSDGSETPIGYGDQFPEDCTDQTELPECTPTLSPTHSPTPMRWTRLLGPLLAFLAVATAGLLVVAAVLARWRLAPGEAP